MATNVARPASAPRPVFAEPGWVEWIGATVGEAMVIALLAAPAAVLVNALGADFSAMPTHRSLLLRTLAFGGVAATAALVIAFPCATLLARASRPWRVATLVMALLPLAMPSSLLATGWIMALGRDGVITGALRRTWGFQLPTIYELFPAACATGFRYAGVALALLLYDRLRRAAGDAAERAFPVPPVQRLLWLRIAPAAPVLAAAWLIVFLLVIGDPIMPGMFLISTYGTQVLVQANALMDLTGAAAMSLPLAAIGCVVVAVAWWLLRSRWRSDAIGLAMERRSRWRGVAACALIALVVGLPLAGHAARARSVENVAASAQAAQAELWRTLGLATLGATATAVVAAVCASRWVATRRTGGWTLAPLVVVGLALPPAMLALGVLDLGQRPGLAAWRDTDALLLAGYVARFAPLVVLMLAALWMHDRADTADAAARLMGVPTLARWWWLSLPRRGAAVGTVAMILLLPIAAELEASVLLVRPGVTTLGVRLYTMIHTSPDAAVSGLAVFVVVVFLALGAVAAAGVWALQWFAGGRP